MAKINAYENLGMQDWENTDPILLAAAIQRYIQSKLNMLSMID